MNKNLKHIDVDDIPKLSSVLLKLYDTHKYKLLREFLSNYYATDVAQALRKFETNTIAGILKVAIPATFVDIFQYIDLRTQVVIVSLLRDYELKYIFENLPDDERTALLHELKEEDKEYILLLLNEEERDIATRFLSYDEDSAASMAISHYAYTYHSYSVEASLSLVQKLSIKFENIYTIYVLDDTDKLVGSIALEQLVFSEPSKKISDLHLRTIISVNTQNTREEAIALIQEYDLMTLPVLNDTGELVGIITHDDAMDEMIHSNTESFQKFGGITGKPTSSENFLKQGIWKQAKRRMTWTIIPVVMEAFTGLIVQNGQSLIESVFLLATYMPMVTAAGGDIGSQSASIVIRALSLKEIGLKDSFFIITKEFRVAIIIAAFVSTLVAIKIALLPHPPMDVSLGLVVGAISLALFIQLLSSAVLGSVIPLIAVIFKLDPAIVSSPVLTSLVDISGMYIYFSCARLILF